MAVKAALHSTIVPRIKVTAMDGGQPELELTDDPLDGVRLDVSKSPILVTLCRIGNHCVVDPTPEEEACSTASLVMGVTPKGQVTAVRKMGAGAFNVDSLNRAVQDGRDIGMEIQKTLLAKIQQEERMGVGRKKIGFMRN
jgi:exosome complex component RRP42